MQLLCALMGDGSAAGKAADHTDSVTSAINPKSEFATFIQPNGPNGMS